MMLLEDVFSSVVGRVKVRPPLDDLGRTLYSRALLVLRGHPGVASWLSHEGQEAWDALGENGQVATVRVYEIYCEPSA